MIRVSVRALRIITEIRRSRADTFQQDDRDATLDQSARPRDDIIAFVGDKEKELIF